VTQANNTRGTLKINIDGDILSLADVCRRYGVYNKYKVVYKRFHKHGWSIQDAVVFK